MTPLYKTLCVLAGLALLAAVSVLRMNQGAALVRAAIDARNQERERIARDLHDTLLQSTQCMIWQFTSVCGTMASDPTERAKIEKALRAASQTMQEIRERISDLRVGHEPEDLVARLSRLADRFDNGHGPRISVSWRGRVTPLAPLVDDELIAVARESLMNVIRHARAAHAVVELSFGDDALTLTVADDGRGSARPLARSAGELGHWGLVGMQERAARIGARLEVESRPASGTTVRMTVPAAAAYAGPRGGRIRRWSLDPRRWKSTRTSVC